MTHRTVIIAALAAAALCLVAWRFHPVAVLAAYLAAWWFWTGLALGGLANVWLHNLTGGEWGEAIRGPLLQAARPIWIAALLFLPVLAGLHDLYPWAAAADSGAARWSGELSAPAFKNAWLMPGFFIARSLCYLLVWSVLALLAQRPRLQRSQTFAAAALLIYGFSVGLASMDWIMSLMPLWYSSVFGWLAATSQMLGGMALAIVLAARLPVRPPPAVFRDLGNLLLMYVMIWAYLAFTQFLIIWAENLPHEIAWYVPRLQGGWLLLGSLLVLFLFAAPLLILLSRQAKEAPRLMAWLALALLGMLLLDAWWLILPSLAVPARDWLWAAPLAALASAAVVLALRPFWSMPAPSAAEVRHA
jgi:hypothetical protein